MIPSLDLCVQHLAPAFTAPAFATHCQLLLGWLMCLGSHTQYRVGLTIHADKEHDHSQRHGLDRFYNFFNRSAWTAAGLASRVAVLAVTHLNPQGRLHLIVDDTLAHKRGRCVFALGWFRDAVASTKKRVATARGHNWVVLGLTVRLPLCPEKVWCLPLLARLHQPGTGQPSCVELTRQMLTRVREWFPDRKLILVGDGAYAAKGLLDRQGAWAWWEVTVLAYGVRRVLHALAYEVVWPTVLGLRPCAWWWCGTRAVRCGMRICSVRT